MLVSSLSNGRLEMFSLKVASLSLNIGKGISFHILISSSPDSVLETIFS